MTSKTRNRFDLLSRCRLQRQDADGRKAPDDRSVEAADESATGSVIPFHRGARAQGLAQCSVLSLDAVSAIGAGRLGSRSPAHGLQSCYLDPPAAELDRFPQRSSLGASRLATRLFDRASNLGLVTPFALHVLDHHKQVILDTITGHPGPFRSLSHQGTRRDLPGECPSRSDSVTVS